MADLQQLFMEAQHRWLRPAEICEILRNYQKFQIASEAPNRPPSGSLFLFDRKVLRYFRKDGHNWRKKKDGKTVKEAHEKLKVGSVDVLHCYYAHGEDNENFQRRSYWSLEDHLTHIVFVHYLEVKGSRTNNSPSNSFAANTNKETSGRTDSTSPTSTLSSLCEDSDSADSHQASSRYYSFLGSPQMHGASSSNFVQPGFDNCSQPSIPLVSSVSHVDGYQHTHNQGGTHVESQSLPSWEDVFQQSTTGYAVAPSLGSMNAVQPGTTGIVGNAILGGMFAGGSSGKEVYDSSLPIQSNWQIPFGNGDPQFSGALDLGYDLDARLIEQGTLDIGLENTTGSCFTQNKEFALDGIQMQFTNAEPQHDISVEGNGKHNFITKRALLDEEESLKKVDSFSRWVTKELGEDGDLHTRSITGISWSNVECDNGIDGSSLSPSLSQDQLFSIINFSPKWAYTDAEMEIHITGTFLRSQQELTKCSWSCMFGEVEVPAEVLADGILCSYAPPHDVGTVPFYVTCSNRLACSEVREFDFLEGSTEDVHVTDVYGSSPTEMSLHMRLEKLLSLRSSSSYLSDGASEKRKLISKIVLLKEEDDGSSMTRPASGEELLHNEAKQQLLQQLLKEKLYSWLLHGVSESGKGSCVLDDDGQGVIHLAASLGYNWAIKPIVTAGISINFRDANGWTALHWAAFYGREETVAVLVSLGASPGALTDPSPEYPLGRTPADLASGNGHKGISGFLAESFLTSYLSSLKVNDATDNGTVDLSGLKVVQTVSERTATPVSYGDAPDALSLKDSLTAMSNATQAANRIYQVFRMQSFQRKQITDSGEDGFDVLDEHALTLLAAKTSKPVQSNGLAHAAAIQIQKKFRGWKKRKEFLIIRQRIVKIQAHFRGHQVRKQYRTIIWSVGILEKVILRWRRKGSGLRGFRRDAITADPSPQCIPSKEDDYDFLKDGRKQAETRTKGALDRVKSMYHNPEGRAQYRRLLTVCEGYRGTKADNVATYNPEDKIIVDEEVIDIDSLLEDEAFMSIAFE
ncbi:hypothetical protein Tsubulata_038398 [Turnera subulata]|uniref:CG-1 domain-containing protein n=1 Tax=Turnera subulata TaxID=218843 RepID=A0A9Q0J694_9ROSI|nr:hypothetical protein Tsubulata_038398 [Turnera subulata]